MGNIMLTNSLMSMKRKGFNLYQWIRYAQKEFRPDLTFIELARQVAYANIPLNARYNQNIFK